jgi:hypothetical protein
MERLFQLRVLRLGLFKDGDVGVGVSPEGEKVFVRGERPYCTQVGRPSLHRNKWLLLGIADEHDVGVGVAADECELAAVEGPVEVNYLLRCEIGNLLAWGTIEGLEP